MDHFDLYSVYWAITKMLCYLKLRFRVTCDCFNVGYITFENCGVPNLTKVSSGSHIFGRSPIGQITHKKTWKLIMWKRIKCVYSLKRNWQRKRLKIAVILLTDLSIFSVGGQCVQKRIKYHIMHKSACSKILIFLLTALFATATLQKRRTEVSLTPFVH